MLYGRRILHSQRPTSAPSPRGFIVSKSFQYKYIWYFLTAVGGAAMLFILPSYFFVQQNYELFKSLAYDTQPLLVSHLERELVWLTFFMGASMLCLAGVTIYLSVRMTKNILLPLIRMEKHMHQLMLGQWSIPDFDMDEQEDFRELSMTYDYFYRSLKASTENDLRMLESMKIDVNNREAYAIWRSLLSEKRSRLGIEEAPTPNLENVVTLTEFGQKRHAS